MRGSMSVVVLGVVIFVVLAFAVYVFRAFPYLLAIVLIAEWLALALAVLGPLMVSRMKRGWIGRIVAVMVTLGLANVFMMFLARHWGVQFTGWFRTTLMLQAAFVSGVLHLAGYVVAFLDALMKAVLGLERGPVEGLIGRLVQGAKAGVQGPLSAGNLNGVKIGLVINAVVGVLGSLFGAHVLRSLLAEARPSHGGGGGGGHSHGH